MPLTSITSADDVTAEILEAAEGIESGWFAGEPRIDWVDFFDRLDGVSLNDGSTLSPALRRIKKHIQDLRRNG